MINTRKLAVAFSFAAMALLTLTWIMGQAQLGTVVVGGMLAAAVILVADTRIVLSKRIQRGPLNRAKPNPKPPVKAPGRPASQVKPPSPPAKVPQSHADDVALVLEAGLFDQQWYQAQQGGHFDSASAACRNYLEHGRKLGYSPHPLFMPSWVAPKDWASGQTDPLIRYIKGEYGPNVATHPVFTPPRDPEASKPQLIDYVAQDCQEPLPVDPELGLRLDLSYAEFRAELFETQLAQRRFEESLGPLRGQETPPQLSSDQQAQVQRFLNQPRHPLVSVILPTWNRAQATRAALESVQRQTYDAWELIVVDDGCVDDTALALQAELSREPRLRYFRQEHLGVSAARNLGLQHARGEYIAFLDSDKQWDPDFLATMVALMSGGGHQAAAACCAVTRNRQTTYRVYSPTRESLALGNSIDQTALMVRRELLEKIGGFDQSLRRAVDYDQVLRLAELTTIEVFGYVGVRYSEDATDPNRISEAESPAWNFHVRDEHKWRTTSPRPEVAGRISLVITAVADETAFLKTLRGLPALSAVADVEAVLIIEHAVQLAAGLRALPKLCQGRVRLVAAWPSNATPQALNQAIREATGEFLYLTRQDQQLEPQALLGLVAELKSVGGGVIHPAVVNEHRLVLDAGMGYPHYLKEPVKLASGLPEDWLPRDGAFPVPGAPLPLLARREQVLEVKGFNALLLSTWWDVDLSQRLAAHSSQAVMVSAQHRVTQPEPARVASPEFRHDLSIYHELWPEPPAGTQAALEVLGLEANLAGYTPLSHPNQPKHWPEVIWSRARVQVRQSPRQLNWSIRIAAPADQRRESWGDYHFAESLRMALEGLGQRAAIEYQDNLALPRGLVEDVVVNLRGLREVPLPAGAISMLWIISHPDQVTRAEARQYDAVFAASHSWAASMSQQWHLPIVPLLQCTDPARFHVPEASSLPPELTSRLGGSCLMVGNTRNQYRPAAWHVGNAGLPLLIWGGGWEGRVPPECVQGEVLPNEQLRHYYAAAKWVLNDHWPDMRSNGFISNRIFDALACGARLITDNVADLDLVGEGIYSFGSPKQLLETVAGEPPSDMEQRMELAAHVAERHSFTARAEVLLETALLLEARRR